MTAPTFAITIRTADRTPQRNYCLETLTNLERSGVFKSAHCGRVLISDTGKGCAEHLQQILLWANLHEVALETVRHEPALTPNQNAIACLKWAAESGSKWHLFLEDDIDVCADFLNGLAAFLDDHAKESCPVYPLCAAYNENSGRLFGKPFWYALTGFYGTQAYVLRTEDSGAFARWTEERLALHPMGQGHDLLLKEWVRDTFPNTHHLICPTPDFVQHLGEESSLHPGRFHKYAMFAGQNWSYRKGAATWFTIKEHGKGKTSKAIVDFLAGWLPKDQPVYDLGCGMGNYVARLEAHGFMATGMEGTPNIQAHAASPNVFTVDLSEPLPGAWKLFRKGSVISIEVGEHIHAKDEAVFLDNIDFLCANKLFLTWAIRGQKGLRHVNEKDEKEVLPLLEARGFRLNRDATKKVRREAAKDFFWFGRSVYVFER